MVCSKNLKEYNWDQVKKAPSGLSLQVTSCLVMARSLNDGVEPWLSEPLDLGQSTGPAVWMGLVTVSPSPISRELLCHICLFICSSLALESFSCFFFFKVKIGLAAEAITRNPQFL